MNRLNVWKFALATAVTFVALDVACALAVIVAPDATVTVFNTWFHGLDLRLLMPAGGKAITMTQVVAGAISAAVVSFFAGALLAGCYNAFQGVGLRHASEHSPAHR